MKILILFGGIGGNRTLWGDEHEITAIENDSDIANIYKKRFPEDILYKTDALEFVENKLDNYDFIWASPECKTHSRLNLPLAKQRNKMPVIPDDKSLYGLIRWLKKFCHGMWVVENTQDYLGFLIRPTVNLGRHFYWSNFPIPVKKFSILKDMDHKSWRQLCEFHSINPALLPNTLIWDRNHDKRRTILRNCVDYRIGKYILDCAIKPKQKTLF